MLEALPLALYRIDCAGALIYANPAMLSVLGRSLQQAIGLRADDLYPAALAEAYREDDRAVMAQGRPESRMQELRIAGSTGPRRVWVHKTPLHDAIGQVVGLQGVFEDLTQPPRDLKDSRLATAVLDTVPQALMIIDLEGRVLRVNPAFEATTGYRMEEAIGQMPKQLGLAQQPADFYSRSGSALASRGSWQGELVNRHRDGGLYRVQMSLSQVSDGAGQASHYVALFEDVSEARAAEEKIQHLAQHDALTGLPNRLLLSDRLGLALSTADRHGHGLAVLFIDLDHFKNINDAHGHAVGDQLLKQAAARITRALRASDTVSRQGGDEFIALLPNLKSPEDALPACQTLLRALAQPFEVDGQRLHVSASIGVASYPADGANIDALLRCADMAMYEAKAGGRGRAQFFHSDLEARARRKASLEADLRRALRAHELFIELQPQINLLTGQISCLEALVRWQHPERGRIPPLDFIPFAEESRLIIPLGLEVLRLACEARASLRDLLADTLPIAVNVSAHQLSDPSFLARFSEEMDRHALAGSQIELEITERALIADVDTTRELLQRLRVLGVRVAIDDFGTGYSNLAVLHRLPLSRLKIDRSFIEEVDSRRSAQEICRAIQALASSLDLKVVAEGVETASQLDFARALGCDSVQGYIFAKPMPLAALRRWLIGRAKPALARRSRRKT